MSFVRWFFTLTRQLVSCFRPPASSLLSRAPRAFAAALTATALRSGRCRGAVCAWPWSGSVVAVVGANQVCLCLWMSAKCVILWPQIKAWNLWTNDRWKILSPAITPARDRDLLQDQYDPLLCSYLPSNWLRYVGLACFISVGNFM